jgi:hypothetical protein
VDEAFADYAQRERGGYMRVEITNADPRKLAEAGAAIIFAGQGLVSFNTTLMDEHIESLDLDGPQAEHVPAVRV